MEQQEKTIAAKYYELTQYERPEGDINLFAQSANRRNEVIIGGEDKDWKGEVGFVPSVLTKLILDPKSTVVVTCGPPIMIKFVFIELTKLGFQPQDIVTTLENKMKCGLGMCGRCNIGSTYVCKDGPVFTYAQMKDLPDEF